MHRNTLGIGIPPASVCPDVGAVPGFLTSWLLFLSFFASPNFNFKIFFSGFVREGPWGAFGVSL
jgi:hypothetical protein